MSRQLLKGNITLKRDDGSTVGFTIKEHIGSGASCVVYHAVCEDNTEHLLKEYYPRKINITRDDTGKLIIPENKRMFSPKALNVFVAVTSVRKGYVS